ncbi:hypothetical protein ACGFZP_10105 [Kitasatospora sp. NPDC048239]|uniref:hypothetical protein n=1 Tax=Kitasatospora sp. NPDC048239 TaxID=3364046 RepID=UPI00371069A7
MTAQPTPDDQSDLFRQQVDAVVLQWSQGDVLDGLFGLRLVDLQRPLSPGAETLRAMEGVSLSSSLATDEYTSELAVLDSEDPHGYAVVSQTCDVVRDCGRQPYIQLCPVVEEIGEQGRMARKFESTQLAWLPALGENLFADLTRVFTAEKSVLLNRTPLHGVTTDAEIRCLSAVIARRFGRFAFPDDLHPALGRLSGRIRDKHSKSGDESRALQELYQIRAEALPHWGAESVEVVLHFILNPQIIPEADAWVQVSDALDPRPAAVVAKDLRAAQGSAAVDLWQELLLAWTALCEPHGRIKSFSATLSSTDTFTLEQYRQTEQLDLEYLSSPS